MSPSRLRRLLLNGTCLALCLLAGAAMSAPATAVEISRGPYLQRGSTTGMVVRWRTDVATDSVVRYGASPAALNDSASDAAPTLEHAVAIDGLSADTRYYYAVGSGAAVLVGGDTAHSFRTAPTAAGPVHVWAIGDAGTGGAGALAVRRRLPPVRRRQYA